MNNRNLDFEQAWKAISDIASACREFNDLQFKYRQLALSLVLAAYAAMGYFWLSVDGGNRKTDTVETAAISTQPAGAAARIAASAPLATPASSGAQSAPIAGGLQAVASPSAATLTLVTRLYLIFLGIGALTAFSGLVIYNIDGRYHRLLNANFEAAKDFESSLADGRRRDLPPLVHREMSRWMPSRSDGWRARLGSFDSVSVAMVAFYMVGSGAALLPGIGFALFHADDIRWSLGTSWRSPFSPLVLCLIALPAMFIVTYRKLARNADPELPLDGVAEPPEPSAPLAPEDEMRLVDLARQHHANAYAPHSGFRVGAAVLASRGAERRIFGGCNVENDSFGLTLCAERNAVAAAVAAGFTTIERVVVFTDTDEVTMPCGACRQVIHQFGRNAAVVAYGRSRREQRTMSQLLPDAFDFRD